MAEGAGELWGGVGARGQRGYVSGDSSAPLMGQCGLETPGQILRHKCSCNREGLLRGPLSLSRSVLRLIADNALKIQDSVVKVFITGYEPEMSLQREWRGVLGKARQVLLAQALKCRSGVTSQA